MKNYSLIALSILFLLPGLGFAQDMTSTDGNKVHIKTKPSGNGAFFDQLKLDKLVLFNKEANTASLVKNPSEETLGVSIDLYVKNTDLTAYHYNGKNYDLKPVSAGYDPNACAINRVFGTSFSNVLKRLTVTVEAGGKTYTETSGSISVIIRFPSPVEYKSVKIISVTLESLPTPPIEERIQDYLKCLNKEKQEKEQPDKKEEKQANTGDDNFWNGSDETEKATLTLSTGNNQSKDDFWSGIHNKKNETASSNTQNDDFWNSGGSSGKETNDDFWSKTNSNDENSKKEKEFAIKHSSNGGKVEYWVEDESGKVIFPKIPYWIKGFREGLVRVEVSKGKESRGSSSDETEVTIHLYEIFYMNSRLEKIPPIEKRYRFSNSSGGLFLRSFSNSEKADEWARTREARKKRQAKERRENEGTLKAKYEAMGYTSN